MKHLPNWPNIFFVLDERSHWPNWRNTPPALKNKKKLMQIETGLPDGAHNNAAAEKIIFKR